MGKLGAILAIALAGTVGLAVLGWLSLRRGDIPFDALEARYASADSRFVDLPSGVRMHYRDQGRADGPVLVLVHGFGASLHTWEPWVRELGRDHRVISLDLPGYGLTRTPPGWRTRSDSFVTALEQFAAARSLERFALAGSSMGGAAAWNYALAHPERLTALILVDAAGWPQAESGDDGGGPLIFRALSHPLGRALLRDLDATALTLQGLQTAVVDKTLITPAMVKRYTDLSRAPGRRAQILDPAGERTPDATPERLAAIRTPTLVMTGEQDAIVPAENARRFAAAVSGALLVAYPNVGHLPQEEVPERSAADVRAFLARATASPG